MKLSDFGLAKEIPPEKSRTEAGTPAYYAPEMIMNEGYGREIDLWMLGVLAYELSNYCTPFTTAELEDLPRLKQLVLAAQHNRPWKNPNLSEELKSFIDSLLRLHPEERLGHTSWEEVKQHAFFSGFDWRSLQEMKMKSPLKSIIDGHRIKLKPYDGH